jgi:hypothetical protein
MALLDPQAFQDVIEEPQPTQVEKEASTPLPLKSPVQKVVRKKAALSLAKTKSKMTLPIKGEERDDMACQTSKVMDAQVPIPAKESKKEKVMLFEPTIAEDLERAMSLFFFIFTLLTITK